MERKHIGQQVRLQHLRNVGVMEHHIVMERVRHVQQSEHDTCTYVRTIKREIHDHGMERINWIRRRQVYD